MFPALSVSLNSLNPESEASHPNCYEQPSRQSHIMPEPTVLVAAISELLYSESCCVVPLFE